MRDGATYIGTAEHDPLRDDGARYAELLSAAGVPVELNTASTMVHGYVSFALVIPPAAEATREMNPIPAVTFTNRIPHRR